MSLDGVHYLRSALAPRSIAVVGASHRADSFGRFVMANVMSAGFSGAVYAVNPKHRTIEGRACVPSLRDLPEKVDLAVVVAPSRHVPAIVDDAAERGVPAALVMSPGLCDPGPDVRAIEQEVVQRARRHKVRLLGPNCLGLMRPDIGLNASWARTMARPGGIALVSQSGAVTTALLDYAWTAGFGFSTVLATGAESDVGIPDVLDFLAGDTLTRSILLYVEGIHDARGFVSTARAAASVKPIIVLKAGRHATDERIAMSHTGALVGNDAVFDAALRRAGAIRVPKIGHLFAAAETLANGRLPRGNRLAILSNGGGPGLLAADAIDDTGVALAQLSESTRAALDEGLPPGWSHTNPVDVLADADGGRLARALRILTEDRANDGVLVLFAPTPRTSAERAAEALLPVAAGADKPVVSAWLGEKDAARGRAVFKAASLPAMTSPERGVEAFSHLAQFVRNRELRLQVPPPRIDELKFDINAARRIIDGARAGGRHTLDEQDSKALLASFGIETAVGLFARSAMEARQAALQLGFPVVLKVRADGITHKSDVGGVLLGLANADEVERGFEAIAARLVERAPQARFLGVLVQKMVLRPHGRELIVGLAHDPTFGPVINFGMGGVAVEVFRDSAVAVPPLNAFLARDLVSRTRVAAMLGAFRGAPAVDLDKLIEVLLRVSELACEIPAVAELDINPLLADEHGVIALDARVVVTNGPLVADATYSHLAIHPYPRGLTRRVTLKGGESLVLRAIRPEDAEAEKRLIGRLSARTSYLRFHAPVRELTLERLVRYTQIDYDREMAFVAVDTSGTQEEIRGISRYTRNPDGVSAEFGVIVEDAWQGRGLGHLLMQALEDTARARGLTQLIGLVLRENEEMGLLMQRRGYAPHRDDDDPGVTRFIKPLLDASPPPRAEVDAGPRS
jgi:acetyltransferase